MGLISSALKAMIPSQRDMSATVPVYQNGVAQFPNTRYDTYAREGYMKNEVVYACIEELSTSAAEPKLKLRSGETWRDEGQILTLLNNPNPFMDRFQFWATVIMHRSLAGNAYALKVRSRSGRPVELWLLRPDRVRVVPSRTNYISHYNYDVGGGEIVRLSADDVIHFKTRHPIDDWYGMPPLMPVSGRTDIDNFMKDFVKSAFENGGMPGAILSVKQKMSPEDKEATKRRFRENFTGSAGWHELLILDNAEASFTPMTMSLGTRGLVVPELNQISIERICSTFKVFPPLIGYMMDAGGYNSLFALERHWWTGTLVPLYKELAGPLNLRLVPDFARVAEVQFDMSDVWALREDIDAIATRWSNLAARGVASLQEAREKVGLEREWSEQDVFLMPSGGAPVGGDALVDPESIAGNEPPEAAPPQIPQQTRGRPSTANDAEARALWQSGKAFEERHPRATNEQVAGYVGVSERTWRRYEDTFGE